MEQWKEFDDLARKIMEPKVVGDNHLTSEQKKAKKIPHYCLYIMQAHILKEGRSPEYKDVYLEKKRG